MSVRGAALVTGGIVALIAGYIGIGAALGLVPLYGGFLLLWYFGAIDALDTGLLPAVALGAAGGTLTAWLLQFGLATWGAAGTLPGLAVIVMAVFLQLLGKLPIVINRAFMLYLTVMAAPLLQMHERFDRVLLAIAVATVYFGGVVILGRWAIGRWSVRKV